MVMTPAIPTPIFAGLSEVKGAFENRRADGWRILAQP